MSWRNEIEDVIDLKAWDNKASHKRYIKEELVRYYYYIDQYLEEKSNLAMMKIRYADYLENPVNTTSFIKVEDKTNTNSNKIIYMQGKMDDIKKHIEYLEERLNELDLWFSWMSSVQKDIIKTYVCKYGCTKMNDVIDELNYSKSSILDVVDKVIDMIYKKTKEKHENIHVSLDSVQPKTCYNGHGQKE